MIPTGQTSTYRVSNVVATIVRTCTRCGALVIDTALHTAWHEET